MIAKLILAKRLYRFYRDCGYTVKRAVKRAWEMTK